MIQITIPGTPVAKGRPRAVRKGRIGVRMYTPAKTAKFEAWCRLAATAVWGNQAPLDGPLSVIFMIYMPIPTSLSAKKRAELMGKPHTKKPDASNIIKAVEDAFNGIVWSDDSQISLLTAHKVYDTEPRIEVNVAQILEMEAA